jgi:hypothetical protein
VIERGGGQGGLGTARGQGGWDEGACVGDAGWGEGRAALTVGRRPRPSGNRSTSRLEVGALAVQK